MTHTDDIVGNATDFCLRPLTRFWSRMWIIALHSSNATVYAIDPIIAAERICPHHGIAS